MSSKKEASITLDGNEIKESEMSEKQKYLTRQCTDLKAKKSDIEFQLDQVVASLNVFSQALVESLKEISDEVLTTEQNPKEGES